jgi:hypothetical protein
MKKGLRCHGVEKIDHGCHSPGSLFGQKLPSTARKGLNFGLRKPENSHFRFYGGAQSHVRANHSPVKPHIRERIRDILSWGKLSLQLSACFQLFLVRVSVHLTWKQGTNKAHWNATIRAKSLRHVLPNLFEQLNISQLRAGHLGLLEMKEAKPQLMTHVEAPENSADYRERHRVVSNALNAALSNNHDATRRGIEEDVASWGKF